MQLTQNSPYQRLCLRTIALVLSLCCGSIFYGCALAPSYIVDGSKQPVTLVDAVIDKDTTWQGTIIVAGEVKIPSGITLIIAPGTRIEFTRRDNNRDGIEDSGFEVNGRLIAKGTKQQNIVFTSHSPQPAPSSWGEVKIEYSPGSSLEYCRFEYASWGLHMHFSAVDIYNCTFLNSEGGLRFRSGPINIKHNLIQHNNTGLRFIHSQPVIEYNTISDNQTGIFIREGVKHPIINYNNIAQNKHYNLKLGESQKNYLDCPNNWWGTTEPELIDKYIFDEQDADYIGRVNYTPFATQAW